MFDRKKIATAVAYCKRGKGLLKVKGPLELIQPAALQFKLQEHILPKAPFPGKDMSANCLLLNHYWC